MRRAACLLALLPALGWAQTREDQFVLLDDMPAVLGELTERVERVNEADGSVHAKEVYRLDTETHRIVTHISSASCTPTADGTAASFYVMAIQYLPRLPRSFREATLHDYFKEVYVTDTDGRVRLYENLSGAQMIELTERFSPRCFAL